MAFQSWIADGMDLAAEQLRDQHALDSEIEIVETRCCALGDFAGAGLHSRDEDLLAGVLLAFRGPLAGTALMVLEPEEALAWARAHSSGDDDAVRTFVELGECALAAVVRAASSALGVETELCEASLQEHTLGGCLLATHAPSDTMLTSSRLRVTSGGQLLDAHFYMLMEPKMMSALLGALSASAH